LEFRVNRKDAPGRWQQLADLVRLPTLQHGICPSAVRRDEPSHLESASRIMSSVGYHHKAVRWSFLVAMLVTAPGVALAYIDPGNGQHRARHGE